MSKHHENTHSSEPISKQDYADQLAVMQVELNNLARWVKYYNKRLLIIFEGRDTAGKGGVINAISATLNPRQCRVLALDKPNEIEKGQWYFQRYVPHLPAAGSIVLMDRSWYNRAGVEKVMGYCSADEVQHFLKQTPVFEKLLVDDGILLFKYWLTVDQVEQEHRLFDRLQDPLKRWKLSPVDLLARHRYAEYGQARDEMLQATHAKHAPWTLVNFNDQRLGRLTLIRHLLAQFPDCSVPDEWMDFPPLKGQPSVESFDGPLQPIQPYKLHAR